MDESLDVCAPVVGEFSGGEHVHSALIEHQPDPQLTVVPPNREVGNDPWIVVDRARSALTLLRNGAPLFTTCVSLGQTKPDNPGSQIGFAVDPAQATPVVIVN